MLQQDRHAEAAEQFRRAGRLNPNDHYTYNNLGLALSEAGGQSGHQVCVHELPVAVFITVDLGGAICVRSIPVVEPAVR